ncbi:hypothetical protein ZWY2020_048655, partial [Hordeum vulgare]
IQSSIIHENEPQIHHAGLSHIIFIFCIHILLLSIIGITNTEHERQEPSAEQDQENTRKLQLKVEVKVAPWRSSASIGLEQQKRWLGRA